VEKKKIAIIVGFIAISLIAASSVFFLNFFKKDDLNNNTVKNTNQDVQINEEEIEPPKEVKVVDTNSNSRPYAIMINNLNEARQIQSGLSDAYLVYELIVEGGITRMLALYKDADTAKIGSVRSARHYYLDYVLENDAIYVHWGQSPQAEEDLAALKINNINGLIYEGRYFYRDNPIGISSEHTGFTKMQHLKDATKNLKYRDTTDKGLLLNYSAESVDLKKYNSVQNVSTVTTVYSNYLTNIYKYDSDTKLYNRYVNNKAHMDYALGEQITAKNIIIYYVKNYTINGDTKGRQFLENIGKGSGYFISEGKSVEITWEKTSRDAKTKYYFEDKSELVVNDGNTFIQILPYSGKIELE